MKSEKNSKPKARNKSRVLRFFPFSNMHQQIRQGDSLIMNAGAMVRENLQAIAADLRPTRSLEKTSDNFHLLDFLIAEARLPFASDPVKPWHYQGWLLPYVMLANAARHDVVNRWGWWAACHLKDELISEPIPHIQFQSEFGRGGKDAFKIIDRCLEIIGRGTGGSWSAYTDFIKWLAWGCGVSSEQPNFNEKTNEELYRAFDLEPFLTRPSDYLGQHLAERKGKETYNRLYPAQIPCQN